MGVMLRLLFKNCGIVAFRDPWGIRPLCFGKRPSVTIQNGFDYCISSESVALNCMDYELTRDVAPGEAVFVTLNMSTLVVKILSLIQFLSIQLEKKWDTI